MVKLSGAGSGLVVRPHPYLTRIVSGTSLIEPMPVFPRRNQPPRGAHVPRLSRDSVVGASTPFVWNRTVGHFLPASVSWSHVFGHKVTSDGLKPRGYSYARWGRD